MIEILANPNLRELNNNLKTRTCTHRENRYTMSDRVILYLLKSLISSGIDVNASHIHAFMSIVVETISTIPIRVLMTLTPTTTQHMYLPASN